MRLRHEAQEKNSWRKGEKDDMCEYLNETILHMYQKLDWSHFYWWSGQQSVMPFFGSELW